MPDWKSKLYVRIISDEGSEILTPIQDINLLFNTPNNRIHSLEADNRGVSKGNDEFNFTLTVSELRGEDTNPALVLSMLQAKHKEFEIILTERQTQASDGDEWAFESVLMSKCYVNQGSHRHTVNGHPVVTVTCISLQIGLDEEYFNGTLGL